MFKLFSKDKKVKKGSAFSEFIRNASSAEKKKVFKRVLEKATEDQRRIFNKVS